jgi:two-component system phosphate regulon response regulator PhoB
MSERTGRPCVLVVDDELPLRELIVVTLGHAFDCLEEGTGADALARLRKSPVELVFLDVMLPDMSGIDVLRAIREDPELASVKVVVVSAWQSHEDVARALETGADRFLSKPFRPEELESLAYSLVGRAA